MNDLWFYMAAKLLEGGFEDLFSVNNSEIGVSLEVRHQLCSIFVIDADSLRQNSRGLVAWVTLVETYHSLLTDIFRAFQREDSGRRYTILDEELCLELCLWEVFEKNSRSKLLGKRFYQGTCDRFVISIAKTIALNKIVEFNEFHVSPLAESVSNSGLA